MNGSTQTVSITDLSRNLSSYVDLLAKVGELVVMRDSKPVATMKASSQVKNANLKKFFGIWKGTELDSDKLWKSVLTRRNRKNKYAW